jgi:hypothetical protein
MRRALMPGAMQRVMQQAGVLAAPEIHFID